MRIPTITRSQRWRRLAVVPVFLLVAAGLQVAAMDAASACGHAGEEQCPPQSGNGGTAGSGEGDSTGTVRQNYSGGGQSCSVYANGTGMGSYCFTVNGTALKSLRERFTGQVFQQCRYRPIPEGMPAPFNAHPADGHYMLQICLQNIDFDTFSGGRGRAQGWPAWLILRGHVADRAGQRGREPRGRASDRGRRRRLERRDAASAHVAGAAARPGAGPR